MERLVDFIKEDSDPEVGAKCMLAHTAACDVTC